jgi:Raf kinase inhibitor-like YbhB/YbcL family protein
MIFYDDLEKSFFRRRIRDDSATKCYAAPVLYIPALTLGFFIMKLRTLILSTLLGLAPAAQALAADSFMVTSPDIQDGKIIDNKHVFNGFGCSGLNVSPALNWTNAPKDTKSFAITVYDPDAPTGSGWWHWVVYNIPATTTGLGLGMGSGQADLPLGSMQGKTDYGTAGYGGPCPPVGAEPHHYIFTVFALKTDKIDVPEGASAAMIGFNLNANKLVTASFTALYDR